jgi:3-oxoacyl-[acyl-carrier-protein] synthase-3
VAQNRVTTSSITGWGTALPDKVVTNDDLAAVLDTSDEWIRERSGIRERRIGGTTSGLAVEAASKALAHAGVAPKDIDLLVLATTTPDQQVPATASTVQDTLGLRCGAFDLNAACSGFVYGLVTAHNFIAGGGMQRVLVVGSETLSRITDMDDRTTAVLFADGAGALVLEAAEGAPSLLGWDLGSDGSLRPILDADIGGYIHMEGKEVFRRAVRVMIDSAKRSMSQAGVTPDDIALVVPHQANIRIIESANAKLGLPMERTALVLDRTGNTSSASIPLALADAADAGRIKAGDLVLLVGFGAGMTWASAVLRWSRD